MKFLKYSILGIVLFGLLVAIGCSKSVATKSTTTTVSVSAKSIEKHFTCKLADVEVNLPKASTVKFVVRNKHFPELEVWIDGELEVWDVKNC